MLGCRCTDKQCCLQVQDALSAPILRLARPSGPGAYFKVLQLPSSLQCRACKQKGAPGLAQQHQIIMARNIALHDFLHLLAGDNVRVNRQHAGSNEELVNNLKKGSLHR